MSWKPEGYTSVSPYLIVEQAQQVIDFLKEVFEAEELRRYETPEGAVMHVEVKIDDTVVMMGEAPDSSVSASPHLHVYVRNVNETYQRAIEYGAASVQEPVMKEGDPDRRGGVQDTAGNTWWISTMQQ
ncbi:VOC family protein [Alteribacillus sp. HJP-4]|uniref:VOC family protein n=1 Tax=Alteribacillus sp. HJP-4 TaxID=2775394 RepID=UPI0035CCEA58